MLSIRLVKAMFALFKIIPLIVSEGIIDRNINKLVEMFFLNFMQGHLLSIIGYDALFECVRLVIGKNM